MYRSLRTFLAALVICAAAFSGTLAHAEPYAGPTAAAAEEKQPAVRVVQVTTRVQVSNSSRFPVTNMVVTVPPSVMDQAASQRVLSVQFATEPESTRKTAAGVEATYRISSLAPGENLTLEQIYTVELRDRADVAEANVVNQQYLQPGLWAESADPAIAAKAASLTKGLKEVDAKAKALVQFVSRDLTYNLQSASRNRGALAGFITKDGVCSEFAGLFVAMARSQGIPARFVYGWASSEELDGQLEQTERHVWAEYFHPQRGWVPVDPTFASVLPLDRVMEFDEANHVAQDWGQTYVALKFGGKGLPSMLTTHLVANAPNIAMEKAAIID